MPKVGFCTWAFAFIGLVFFPFGGVLAATAKPAQWLQIRIGPDSAACGFTIPNNPHRHKLPVLLWLHGGMRSGNTEKGFTAHRAALELVAADSFYFVSPSAYAQADWLSDPGIHHIDQALEWVFTHYPARADSILAMGVSDGTLGVIRYTLHGKYPLARRILVSTFPDLALPANQVPQAASLRHGSWDIFVGGQDRLFPNGLVMASLEVWRHTLPRLTVHFEPLGEHDVSWWFAHQKPNLTAALGSQMSH